MSGNKNKVIAFNYFGGKFTWIDYLYNHFPDDIVHFGDVFGGSFVVSLNYNQQNVIRTANEINAEVTNFYKVLRDHEEELIRLLEHTPCSKLEYDNAWTILQTDSEIEQARKFYVRVRQSFFSLGAQRKNKGWHMAKEHVNCQGGETVSKWNNSIPKLADVAKIIRQNFQITNYDYSYFIDKIDFPGAFFYCDPPYPEETRKSFNDYKFEFSTEKHIHLSEKLHAIQGKAMISSYESDLYSELYKDWRMVAFPEKKNNIRSGKVREVIWMNYEEPKKHDLFS